MYSLTARLFRMTLLTAHTPYRVCDVWPCSPHIHRTEFVTSHNEQKKQKVSSVAHAHRVTSMADINIDAVRQQKKAEYSKQYRLKRKLLLQQQTSKNIYMIGYFLP
jgi:spore germination cell wall hydrolase CwlJ-like protein